MHAACCRSWYGRARSWAHGLTVLLLLASLAGCGGGGGSSGSAGSSGLGTTSGGSGSQTTASLNVEADQAQAFAGGAAVTLTASGGAIDPNTVQWSLAPGSPGALSHASGNRTEYISPPAGSVNGNTIVTVVAASGNITNSIVILVSGNAAVSAGTAGASTITPPAAGNSAAAPAPGIYLIAGNDFGPGMANGLGTAARFDTPSGIARDGQGNLYVADRFNNVVRKIDPQGNVTTFAGMPGERGYVDAQGTNARFSVVSGIAVDGAGNVYVDDYGNALIRKITPDGRVSTLAGHAGKSGHSDGQGSDALFGGNSSALAVDGSGNVYVAETLYVRKIAPDGMVTTLASASAGFAALNGIAVDNAGNVYVSDGGWMLLNRHTASETNHLTALIRKIAPSGVVSTLAGTESKGDGSALGFADGAGTTARFNYPSGLTIDRIGNLYVADRGNHVVRKVTPDGMVTTIAGTPGQGGSRDGPVNDARFTAPSAITVDAQGVLYITDMLDHTVRRIVPGGGVTTIAGAAPRAGSADGAGSAALFNHPTGLAHDNAGNLYVADTGNATIRKITGNQVATIAGAAGQTGAADGTGSAARFNRPLGVAADVLGNIFVADSSNYLVRRITPAGMVGTYAGSGQEGYLDGPALSAQFMEPNGVAVDMNGNVYVADRSSDAIRKITPQGMVSTLAGHQDTSYAPYGFGTGNELGFPLNVAVDKAGNVYTIDSNTAVRKITPDGRMTTLAGVPFRSGTQDGTGSAARFNAPQGLTVDDDGNVYVADSRAIRKITPSGVVTTVAGASASGQSDRLRNIYQPSRIAVPGPKSLAFTSGNGVFELRLP